MAVKVVFNVFSSDDSRFVEEFDADRIGPDPEAPDMLALFKDSNIIGYVPQTAILSAVKVEAKK